MSSPELVFASLAWDMFPTLRERLSRQRDISSPSDAGHGIAPGL
jgi:hypothetical protein